LASNFCTQALRSPRMIILVKVLNKSLKDGVVDIKRQGDMIILVRLLIGDLVFNVISTYAPQIDLNESIKR
jgi:hypothetical protein